jgi:glutathione synthase/RimK-type ligase-like ATP-grasp enzyme
VILFAPPSPQPAAELVAQEIMRRGHSFGHKDFRAAYVRLVNYGVGKAATMGALVNLQGDAVPTVPEHIAINLYDDKAAQVVVLSHWSPPTELITDRADASRKMFDPPFISKSAHGSASKNVRMIRTTKEAEAEIAAAFGEGIQSTRGTQRGYLIWQRFVPGNKGDVRVCVTGDYLFGLTRDNRPDAPFASGSGSNQPITKLDARTRAAFEMAREIAEHIGSRWCCFDFVFEDHKPLCLEVSFAWSEPAYADCVLFDRDLNPTQRLGKEWPLVAVDELERLAA